MRGRGVAERGVKLHREKGACTRARPRARISARAPFCTQKLLGFELDDDDIKVIEKTLRVKYCGQGGLYGAC